MRKTKTTKPIRQGDVMFLQIRTLPKGERTKRSTGIVAAGEATGHHHRLTVEDQDVADVLEIGKGLFVHVSESGVSIKRGATFVHEEHAPVTLPPGNYKVVVQREYQPQGIVRVVD
jgi:hypothetical protein